MNKSLSVPDFPTDTALCPQGGRRARRPLPRRRGPVVSRGAPGSRGQRGSGRRVYNPRRGRDAPGRAGGTGERPPPMCPQPPPPMEVMEGPLNLVSAGSGGEGGRVLSQPVPPLLPPLRQRGEGDTPRLLPPGSRAERRDLSRKRGSRRPSFPPKHLFRSRVRPCPDGSGAQRPSRAGGGSGEGGGGWGALGRVPPRAALLRARERGERGTTQGSVSWRV